MVHLEVLIKTGQLANRVGVLPSKIRFYVKEGLLNPKDYTPGGYYLFDESAAVRQLELISKLKREQRLTISEIKKELAS